MTKAEELREAVVAEIRRPYPESVFRPVVDERADDVRAALEAIDVTVDAWSADTIRLCVGQPHTATDILRAIVTTLGITEEMVGYIRQVAYEHEQSRREANAAACNDIADALSALLEAAR